MRARIIYIVSILLLYSVTTSARSRHRDTMNEQDMVRILVSCLQNKDAYTYTDLFPPSDSMASWVVQYANPDSAIYQQMVMQLDSPVIGLRKDSALGVDQRHVFDSIIRCGEQIGIHWNAIVQVRYELMKMRQTRDVVWEKVAPTRFVGFIFVRDMLNRKTYCIPVGDILQIQGQWYGGQLKGVYEAATIDEYMAALHKKPGKPEPAAEEEISEEEMTATTKHGVVLDRKYYTGMFDNEIPIKLYIRYLKGGCPEGICAWEAIYKFGDQDDYITLRVSKDKNGKWIFAEDPPLGGMDLKLNKDVYTGNWTSTDGETGYQVKLKEQPLDAKLVKKLDALIQ